jgi:hypothetical protein
MHCPHRLHLFESVSMFTSLCSLPTQGLITYTIIQIREKSHTNIPKPETRRPQPELCQGGFSIGISNNNQTMSLILAI